VPLIFMGVFGVGTALAGVAGVIAGPVLGTFPGMAFVLGSIVFVTIVIGGLGSLWGALVASLLIGWITTFAKSYNIAMSDILNGIGIATPENLDDSIWRDLWTVTSPQIADILPYILMVLILIFRPYGLLGNRDA
jgi:branched-chain amino acid transport system permease protein